RFDAPTLRMPGPQADTRSAGRQPNSEDEPSYRCARTDQTQEDQGKQRRTQAKAGVALREMPEVAVAMPQQQQQHRREQEPYHDLLCCAGQSAITADCFRKKTAATCHAMPPCDQIQVAAGSAKPLSV